VAACSSRASAKRSAKVSYHVERPIWMAVLALAVLTTAFAFVLYFNLIASAGATTASLVTLLVPVSAIILNAVFLGERLDPFEFAGMTLSMASLIIIDGRARERRAETRSSPASRRTERGGPEQTRT
jgi:drug/metabolite transporter (DMT)-like permease